jgi:alpha-methylacyl-CoA racemase
MTQAQVGSSSGPLLGLRIIELAGIGPAQMGAMMLSDMGADVVRVDRVSDVPEETPADACREVLSRGRRSIAVDLKSDAGRDVVLRLIAESDVLIDPYRPGVTERLGIGPDVCTDANPGLIYARMTGWGQSGPLSAAAGHDINYIALAGALQPMGVADAVPPVPLNLIGDFGGGGMLLAFGIAAALVDRARTGLGDVIDVAMVDGVASLMAGITEVLAAGEWTGTRESHWLQGGAPWYRAYRTADDRFVAVGALEGKFYVQLIALLGLDPEDWPQWDESRWPALHREFEQRFASRSLAVWRNRLEGTDACFAPALSLEEAAAHPHIAERRTYVRVNGSLQPAPAPRFRRVAGAISGPAPWPGEHTVEILSALGIEEDGRTALLDSGAFARSSPRGMPSGSKMAAAAHVSVNRVSLP